MGINRWSHVHKKDIIALDNINTYNEMVKFSKELTGNLEDSVMPAIRKFGGPEFRFMFKKMMIKKGYVFERKETVGSRLKKIKPRINSTGLKGCIIERGKYKVVVSVKRKAHYLGRFDTIDLAREARANFIKENNLTISL